MIKPIDNAYSSEDIKKSYIYCEKITTQNARNFYYGVRLVPHEKQRAMFAIYAWMRAIDDLIDGKGTRRSKLKHWHRFYAETVIIMQNILPKNYPLPKEDFWPAFRDTVLNYQIPFHYFQLMLDGQLQDLQQTHYDNFSLLYDYCYKVASSVGLICIKIWGIINDDDEAKKLAEWQGIAFQLTNILRDVQEDSKNHHYYLPGVQNNSQDYMPAIKLLIAKTEEYYHKSLALENYIQQDSLACLLAMREIYYAIFCKIKANPYIILQHHHVHLSIFRKIIIAAKVYLFGHFHFLHHVHS